MASPSPHDAASPALPAGDLPAGFRAGAEISLQSLSAAFAELLGEGVPTPDGPEGAAPAGDLGHAPAGAAGVAGPMGEAEALPGDEAACEISPRSILEAILFVGHPHNEPITSQQIAALMRGVEAAEIDGLVQELNAGYEAQGRTYTIVSEGAGYRLALRPEFAPLRDRFYGRVKEIRLSQAAIDVLAIVAYQQPLQREEVDQLRGKPSGALLTQLVRRQLLRIERPEDAPRDPRYRTTQRFLDLFHLEDLADLPQSQDPEAKL